MGLDPKLHFADIGVFISVLNSLTRNKDEFERDVVKAVGQLDRDFERVSLLPSFIANMTAARNAITSGEGNIVTAAGDYHLSVLADDLESDANTVRDVITALFAKMAEAKLTFLKGGNFDRFYRVKFKRDDVPTGPAGERTVDDSLGD